MMIIPTYARNSQPMELIREAINISANGEAIHHRFMLISQKLGYQGMKRWHRYESAEDRDIYIGLQNYVLDMFDEIIEPNWDFDLPAPNDIKELLKAYLDWEITVYRRISIIANDLISAGFHYESELVAKCLPAVRKEIEIARRKLLSYESVGWDKSYIKLSDDKLHDKMKDIEKR